ncbi:MAG: hypothetical protein R6V05_00610 [Candidatus Brocadiia bacterium]
MDDTDETAAMRKSLQSALADILRDDRAIGFFREHIESWCKSLASYGQPDGPRLDAGRPTRFGSVGPLAKIAALMEYGPDSLTEACVVLGALHDEGPHVGRIGQAAPPEWDTEAQAVCGEEDPQILDWAAHSMWHIICGNLSTLSPGALQRLPAWLERIQRKVGVSTTSADATATQHGMPSTATESKLRRPLAPRYCRAWIQYMRAVQRGGFDGTSTDREVYNWLLVHREDIRVLPKFATWARYLRGARKEFGAQKNLPRYGRSRGGPVVLSKDVERPDQDSKW